MIFLSIWNLIILSQYATYSHKAGTIVSALWDCFMHWNHGYLYQLRNRQMTGRNYNIYHNKCSSLVERTIGMLKGRMRYLFYFKNFSSINIRMMRSSNFFRCLLLERKLRYSPQKLEKITMACVILHNILIKNNVRLKIMYQRSWIAWKWNRKQRWTAKANNRREQQQLRQEAISIRSVAAEKLWPRTVTDYIAEQELKMLYLYK